MENRNDGVITLTDENGNETELEIFLSQVYADKEYVFAASEDSEDAYAFYVDENNKLVFITDDDELSIADMLLSSWQDQEDT